MVNNKNAIIITLVLALVSCAPGTRVSGGLSLPAVQVWFDAPLPGTILYPPNPCQIVAHASSPEGIASFQLLVNGSVVNTLVSQDDFSSLVTLTHICDFYLTTGPGEYVLSLRALDNAGNWSETAFTSVILPGEGIGEETPDLTRTQTPARSSPGNTPAATGSVTITNISTDLLYIGREDCGPMSITISSIVTAPKPIVVVGLFYRFQEGTATDFLYQSMLDAGGGVYQATVTPEADLGGSVPFDQAILEYQVIVQQSDGDTSLRSSLMGDVTILKCTGG